MKANKGESSRSTDFKGFGAGSSSGIPKAMPAGGQTAHTKGNSAKFAAGKKTVSK